MERHNPYSQTRPEATTGRYDWRTDPRDLARRAGEAENEGDWQRAVSLYCEAAELAYEAAKALGACNQDYWCRQAATAAREAADEARNATENMPASSPAYRDCRNKTALADRAARDAESLADDIDEANAHSWA